VSRVLTWTTDYFGQHNLASPRLDAEVLLAHALEQDRLALYLRYEDEVPGTALQAYRGMIRRRVDREPIAYITGTREFYGIPFTVDSSVLVPRPETEHLVEYVIRHVENHPVRPEQGALKIFEIGTGCGNLCIALAKHLPQAQIVSTDISLSAISVAGKNLRGQPDCCDRIRLFQGDLLQALAPRRAAFHVIVTNPPYVAAESWDDLPPEVRDHEPRVALDGGRRGTEILHRILEDAAKHLLPGGTLVMEIGEEQAEELLGKAEDTGQYGWSEVLDDYAGKPRVLVAET
jgi:release factor glutamine methyltransferase